MFDLLSTPVDSDIAFRWIQVLFPVSKDGVTEATAYGSAFAVFTSTLSFFGGLFLAWHVIQGIVLSAYTGKVLGERFHQIWAPLRVVLGFGLLVPIAGGFSSVHLLLRNVVGVAAVQAGNAPITAYIKKISSPTDGAEIHVSSIKGRFVFDEFLDKEVCYAVVTGLNDSIWKKFWSSFSTPAVRPESNGRRSGNDYVYNYGSCGSITFILPDYSDKMLEGSKDLFKNFKDVRATATDELMQTVRQAINPEKLGKYFLNHDVRKMDEGSILKALRTEGVVPANLAEIKNQAGDKWNKAVADSAAAVYKSVMDQNGKELNERIEKFGFMAAGGFERALSKASAITVSLANASPKVVQPNLEDEYKGPYLSAKNAILSTPKLTDESKGDGSMAAHDNSEPVGAFFSFLAPSIAAMKAGTESVNGDPIGDMISFGHNLLVLWEGGILFLLGLKTVAILAEATAYAGIFSIVNVGTGGASGVLTYSAARALAETFSFFYSWISPVLLTMLIVGILHAFVLPMLPMIMVFIMGISWLILFLEAAIAGVIWAFAFIRMDGQEMFDKNQAPGVTLLFNLFLRPAIGMLAFIGGLKLLPEVMNSLSILWNDSFNAQTTGGWAFIIQWIVGMVMYTWMQWHLSLRIFGLIPTIADRVGHWTGFGNSHGYNDGQETTAAIGAAVAAGQVGRTMQRRPQMKDKDAEKQRKEQRAQAVAAKKAGQGG
jgi:hypothetical protein